MTNSGLPHARVNLSARAAKEQGLLTSGTYGPPCSTSLESEDLRSSWVNKLKALVATAGSPLYTLTWREKTTSCGLRVPRLLASAQTTHGQEFTGRLPTPTASEYRDKAIPAALARMDKGGRIARRICALSSTSRLHLGTVTLNPSFARMMMGIPAVWDACAPTETASTLRKRRDG